MLFKLKGSLILSTFSFFFLIESYFFLPRFSTPFWNYILVPVGWTRVSILLNSTETLHWHQKSNGMKKEGRYYWKRGPSSWSQNTMSWHQNRIQQQKLKKLLQQEGRIQKLKRNHTKAVNDESKFRVFYLDVKVKHWSQCPRYSAKKSKKILGLSSYHKTSSWSSSYWGRGPGSITLHLKYITAFSKRY